MENYLKILEEALEKKSRVLDEIAGYNEEQEKIFSGDKADLEQFDEYIDKKDALIEKLSRLDEGFETLYANVSEQLKMNKAQYADQIRRLQTLVREVTDKSVSVQAQEARNKALIERYFAKQRENVRSSRKNSKAAYDYYKSMSGSGGQGTSQFWDSRK